MTVPRDPALRLLLDRAELHDLMVRYAVSIDRRDFEGVAACFAPDVGGRFGPNDLEGRDGLIEYIRGVARFRSTMHMMGSQFTALHDDEAQLDTLAMLMHRATSRDGSEFRYDPSDTRYSERAARRDGRWIFVARGAEPAWAAEGVSAVSSDDPALRWLLDRAEITDLLASYALGIDVRDWDRVRTCLAPGFRADFGAQQVAGAEELIAYLRGVERFASTSHFLGAALLTVAGDEAVAETPVLITHREQGDAEPEWASRRSYRDRLVRHEGRWRLLERGPQVADLAAANSTSADPDVRALLDRAGIHDLIARLALALDRRDEAAIRSCIEPKFRASIRARRIEGPDAFVAHAASEAAVTDATQRLLGNQLATIEGDLAEVETYAYVSQQREPRGPWTHWSEGATRYLDSLVRRDGRWLLAARAVEGAYSRPPPPR